MVLAERNSEIVRNGRPSRGPSPNGHGGHSGGNAGASSVPANVAVTPDTSSDDDNSVKRNGKSRTAKNEYEEKIRVGRDYQAVCPPLLPEQDRKPEYIAERALLVWSPTKDIPDAKLEEYISVAKEKYGYNGEQALGMLFWHKHDLERAVMDLANFTPFPDEWTIEDKVLFEQAFQFHGKSFHRIRQMLPDKSIASLVKYYYSWKKTRTRHSVMDRQEKLKPVKEGGGGGGNASDNASENGSNEESDNDDKAKVGIAASANTTNSADQQSHLSQQAGQHSQQQGTAADMDSYASIAGPFIGMMGTDVAEAVAAATESFFANRSSTTAAGNNNGNNTAATTAESAGEMKDLNSSSTATLPLAGAGAGAGARQGSTDTPNKDVLTSKKLSNVKSDPFNSVDGAMGKSEAGATTDKGNGCSNGFGKGCCDNCGVPCNVLKEYPRGKLCSSCYHHWRRTGNKRPTTGPFVGKGSREKRKTKSPRGMYINYDDIATMAASNNNPDVLLASIEREIVTLKNQVQNNKQQIATLKRKNMENIDDLRPPESTIRQSNRWTNDEMLLAVEGVRKYGKDFEKIAEVIGTKSEAQLRTFYMSNRRRYNLDLALKKYETDKEAGDISDDDIIAKITAEVIQEMTAEELAKRTLNIPKTTATATTITPTAAAAATASTAARAAPKPEPINVNETIPKASSCYGVDGGTSSMPSNVRATNSLGTEKNSAVVSNSNVRNSHTKEVLKVVSDDLKVIASQGNKNDNDVVVGGNVVEAVDEDDDDDVQCCQEIPTPANRTTLTSIGKPRITVVVGDAAVHTANTNASKGKEPVDVESSVVVSVTSEEDSSLECNTVKLQNITSSMDMNVRAADAAKASATTAAAAAAATAATATGSQSLKFAGKSGENKENNASVKATNNTNELGESNDGVIVADDDDDDVMEIDLQSDLTAEESALPVNKVPATLPALSFRSSAPSPASSSSSSFSLVGTNTDNHSQQVVAVRGGAATIKI